ncbi:OmpA family protein [Psychromonas sp. SP041]|uniref:OmpA family protein n=1 Tax=Psychromonas sp. SP041 TaxID=1365007 RepID=UPI0003FBFACE|nr:OmpA family protein [Psychromonas sp. SP041]
MKLKIATLVSGITLLSACSTVPEPIAPQEIVSTSTFFQTNIDSVATIVVPNECIPYLVIEDVKLTGFTPRYFDFNMDTPIAVSNLQQLCVVGVLKAYPVKVELQGYTDNVGRKSYNQKLAKRRSQSVEQELVNLGVDRQQVTLVENAKIMKNQTDSSLSRRVSLTLK